MIAASKLKRAQDAAFSSRSYVEKITAMAQAVSQRTGDTFTHEYMTTADTAEKTLVIAISPDKGLCGGLITNLYKELHRLQGSASVFLTVGKKAENGIKRSGKELVASFVFGNILPSFDMVYPIMAIANDLFLSKKVKSIDIVSATFESYFSQKVTVSQFLPIRLPETEKKEQTELLFEPIASEILPVLFKRYAEMVLYQKLLESFLSEQAARMISMQNATNNAKDIIEDLRLEYNKTRQAKITSEILDITSASSTIIYAQ